MNPEFKMFSLIVDNCNYFYKRGKLKGKVCKNNCEMDKLYCKEHINSLFIDKRDIILRNLSEFNPLDFLYSDKFGETLSKTFFYNVLFRITCIF